MRGSPGRDCDDQKTMNEWLISTWELGIGDWDLVLEKPRPVRASLPTLDFLVPDLSYFPCYCKAGGKAGRTWEMGEQYSFPQGRQSLQLPN